MYEGLFHKLADQNLALADRAGRGRRLSSGSNRGLGGGSRAGARSCANGAERDLVSNLPIGPLVRKLVGPASIAAFP